MVIAQGKGMYLDFLTILVLLRTKIRQSKHKTTKKVGFEKSPAVWQQGIVAGSAQTQTVIFSRFFE